MQYVIFGVISLVGLVFLIVYNVRVDSNRKKEERASSAPSDSLSIEPKGEADVSEAEDPTTDPVLSSSPIEEKEERLVDPASRTSGIAAASSTKQSDHHYREALRSFGSAALEKDKEGVGEAPPQAVSKDEQFRDALRSIKNQE